jgi:hypothetical protein
MTEMAPRIEKKRRKPYYIGQVRQERIEAGIADWQRRDI